MAATGWDGQAFEAHRPLLFSIAYRMLGSASAPGLLVRHPVVGNGTYTFEIVDGRIRAIYIVRNPDKLRRFLEQTQPPRGQDGRSLGPI